MICSSCVRSAWTVLEARLEQGDEGVFRADQPLEHRRDARDDRVEIEALAPKHLLAAEGEEPLGELRCALGGVLDELDVAPPGSIGAHAVQDGRGASENDGEQVVEVMGDPARQAPDRLDPLRLLQARLGVPEGRLGALAILDVTRDGDDAGRTPGVVAEKGRGGLDPDRRAVAVSDSISTVRNRRGSPCPEASIASSSRSASAIAAAETGVIRSRMLWRSDSSGV